MRLTNKQNIALSMAVFLAVDNYDYDPRPNAVSATTLLKSVRQIVLSKRAAKLIHEEKQTPDISTFVASRFGSAIHDGVEKAWTKENYTLALHRLGVPKKKIDSILINYGFTEDDKGNLVRDPSIPDPPEDAILVFMEVRSEKEINGVIVTGKFDFIGDGFLEDHKTTGVYTYMKKSNDEKFRRQGSIYRWLNPDLVTQDTMLINYVFTDWSKLKSQIEKAKNYPPHRMMSVPFTLHSKEETEKWVGSKVDSLKLNWSKPEKELPPCSSEELWQDKTVYKYYKNPSNKKRSTRNFDTFAEAQLLMAKDGNIGCIDIIKGQAKACNYCNGAPLCSQAKQMVLDGILDMEV